MEQLNAKDLRIGNVVKDGHDVIVLDKDSLICALSGRCEFDSVPLTEEWINEKFDLEWHSEGIYEFSGWCVTKKDGFWEFSGTDTELYYVHQLQNLYHALTGQELTIK